MSENQQLPKNVIYYGTEEPLPEQVNLRAGPLELVFEAGDLRRIRLGEHEIARRIYVAIRDRNWGTVPNRISNLSINATPSGFDIGYHAENRKGEIDFRWDARIAGDESGTVSFSMRGTAQNAFLKNRIGLCILHPIKECAGRRCIVTKTDGTVEEGQFPLLVSPHQPFLDFRGIRHDIDAATVVEFRFEGDVFEMEDQRNWTDASFKTYSTPLRLPYPALIQAGTAIEQAVRVKVSTTRRPSSRRTASRAISLLVDPNTRTPLPAIGLGATAVDVPELDSGQVQLLRRLNPSYLRVDFDLARLDAPNLDRAVREAALIGVPLEVALFLPGGNKGIGDRHQFLSGNWLSVPYSLNGTPLDSLFERLAGLSPSIARWLVFNRDEKCTSASSVRLVRDQLARVSLPGQLVSGTDAYFAELNRARPWPEGIEGVCYSINPQVHASDNDSLVENLAAQGDTVETARHFAGALPIYVSPVTLRPRFNPNATGPGPEKAPGQLPPQVDVRQMSLFGAAWTVGSLKYLGEAGVSAVTYYETCGWRGVMETGEECPLPARFRSVPGGVFPLYHVLADVSQMRGGDVLKCGSSDPLLLDGMIVCRGDRLRVLLANMGRDARLADLHVGKALTSARVRILDETSVEQATTQAELFGSGAFQPIDVKDGRIEVELRSYAVATIDAAWGSA